MAATRADFRGLEQLYLPIAVGVFALIVVAALFAVVRFRARPGRAVRSGTEAPRTELAYVVVLGLVAAGLLWVTLHAEGRVDALAARPALRIHVTAAKWRWRFDYPAQGVSQVQTGTRPAVLVVPAGRTVRFDMTSIDVIHAFWIPAERFKRDAYPRRSTSFDMRFEHTGFSDGGLCAQFCGLFHDQMRFAVNVLTPSAFAAWVAQRRGAGSTG